MVNLGNKRIVYLDVVKFLAIWMVCIGHSYNLVTMKSASILNNWIYSFHMPLFMLLCGYFSLGAYKNSFFVFLQQKTIQLLVPVISITLLTIIVCYLMGVPNLLIIVKSELVGGMWFLRTLFFCYFYTYVVRTIVKNNFLACIGSILLALIVPHGYFLQFNWMLIFFWSGFFLRLFSLQYERFRFVVTVVSLLVFLMCNHEAPQLLTYEVLFRYPPQLLLQYITGLSGSLSLMGCTYYVCKWIRYDSVIINFFAKVGTYTLGIYGLQAIVLQRLMVNYIHISNIFFVYRVLDFIIVPCIGFISMILCYFLIQILKRNKILNILLFGNQYKK